MASRIHNELEYFARFQNKTDYAFLDLTVHPEAFQRCRHWRTEPLDRLRIEHYLSSRRRPRLSRVPGTLYWTALQPTTVLASVPPILHHDY